MKRLVEQVKRNRERFPDDFLFQLRKDEAAALRSQISTSNTGRGGRRYAPFDFTEQGVAMLSSVLRSNTAIAVNINPVRAFVELRRVAGSFQELQKRLDQVELDIGWSAGVRARPRPRPRPRPHSPRLLPGSFGVRFE